MLKHVPFSTLPSPQHCFCFPPSLGQDEVSKLLLQWAQLGIVKAEESMGRGSPFPAPQGTRQGDQTHPTAHFTVTAGTGPNPGAAVGRSSFEASTRPRDTEQSSSSRRWRGGREGKVIGFWAWRGGGEILCVLGTLKQSPETVVAGYPYQFCGGRPGAGV